MSGARGPRRPVERDPDRIAVRRSAIGIAARVAVVSAALVVVILGLVVAWVLWQSTPGEQLERHPDATRIYVDRDQLLAVLAVVGGAAVALAGTATWLVARRTVTPIGEALRMQRTFVADASHELRTPLTVLDARVQLLERRTAPDDPNRPIVGELRDDARALVAIVDDLLHGVAAEAVDGAEATTPVGPELRAAVRDLGVIADPRGVHIDADVDAADGAGHVAMPAVPLRRCFVALLDNAVAHSPDDGTVRVAVALDTRLVRVTVGDRGTGITGIEPARVFDRFAHGTPTGAATHRTGSGIGLALVRDLAVRYGGDVRVVETGPSGTVFELRLRRAD